MKNTSLAQRSQFGTQSSSISKVNTTCPYTSTMYHYVLHGTCLCFFHWMGRQKHRRCPSTAKAKRIHSIAERLATDYLTQRERNSIWSILTPSSHGKKYVIRARARVRKISANIAWLFQRGYCKGLSSLQDESSSRLRLRLLHGQAMWNPSTIRRHVNTRLPAMPRKHVKQGTSRRICANLCCADTEKLPETPEL